MDQLRLDMRAMMPSSALNGSSDSGDTKRAHNSDLSALSSATSNAGEHIRMPVKAPIASDDSSAGGDYSSDDF
jgi:hypothetical protein